MLFADPSRMGGCFSSNTNSSPASNSQCHAEETSRAPPVNKPALAAPSVATLQPTAEQLDVAAEKLLNAQQLASSQQGSVTEKQLQEALNEWQKQHESQSTQLQQLITLQSQEITTLRAQVIDLQAHRQQQQIQNQRAAYIKSQMFPSANGNKMQIPQDCCAAAMACCFAIEEMKADLKAEGQIISKQLEALLDFHDSPRPKAAKPDNPDQPVAAKDFLNLQTTVNAVLK
ncbi:MAG: hypothetical protein FRX49_13686 [Trebouxia sp. A1-2]|nr:MAG: hypothetical protein FRX49_13686 [Trebouxia sp. A1-2]